MDAGANDSPALAHGLQGQRHEIADRRIDDRHIERLRRHFVGSSRPRCTEAAGKRLCVRISRTRERKHRPPLPLCNLRNDMARRTKTVDPQLFAFTGNHQRTPPDQAGAKQWG